MEFVLSLRISWCLSQMLQLYTDILEENSKAIVRKWEAQAHGRFKDDAI